MTSTALTVPTSKELEALSPEELWDVAEVASQVSETAWAMADELLRQWVEVDLMTQVEIAKRVGRSQARISQRCSALGIASSSRRGRPRNISADNSEPEVVDAEIVEDDPAPRPRRTSSSSPEGPAHYLPDVVAADADQNLRTQALHWFEQGQVVRELLNKKKELTARSDQDRAAIKREAAVMEKVARRLKEAL